MHSNSRRSIFFAACALCCAPAAHAQCEPEWHHPDAEFTLAGTVQAAAEWDPDGPGPQPVWLVFGGEFTVAGTLPVSNLAAWDGAQWHDLGGGVNGPVYSLAAHAGQLFVQGDFSSAGGTPAQRIAAWDGAGRERPRSPSDSLSVDLSRRRHGGL